MEANDDFRGVPFGATHPTEIIKDELKARGMPRKEFAARMGMQAPNVSRLLKGEDITTATAARLEAALGIPAEQWLSLQAQYERDAGLIAERKLARLGEARGGRAVLNPQPGRAVQEARR